MSSRLNDIANELDARAAELANDLGFAEESMRPIATALHGAAQLLREHDRGESPLTGCHRVSFIILGSSGAVSRTVRRMLDNEGLEQVAFQMAPATRLELAERYDQITKGRG